MNEIQTFTNEEFGSLRTIEIDGMIWFVGKDVAIALGYKNTKDALRKHVDPVDRRVVQRSQIATFENHLPKEAFPMDFVPAEIPVRGLTFINESGLYSLILSSKLPKAKEFKHWVTSEVLPLIRKTGQYTLIDKPAAEAVMDVQTRPLTPDDYIAAARIVAKCKRDRLPIVVELLRKGGWDLGHVSDLTTAMSAGRATSDIGAILRMFTDAGGRLSRLSELTGISASTLRNYRLGVHFPFQDRYNVIVNAVTAEVLGGNG